nr:DUF3971 domain-containing protein [Oryzicola mucosus]
MEPRVNRELPPAEKIRFKRGDICNLGALPSAEGQDLTPRRVIVMRRTRKSIIACAAIVGGVVLLAVLLLEGLSFSGFGQERLRQEAEAAIERLAGMDVDVSSGQAHLAFDGPRLIAVEIPDVSLKRADGVSMMDNGTIRFGIRLLPLLYGNVRLSNATVSQARVVVGAMPDTGRSDWLAGVRNGQGLVDPDKLVAEVFSQLNKAFDSVAAGTTRKVSLQNVDFMLPAGGSLTRVSVVAANVSQSVQGALHLAGTIDFDGRKMNVTATATRQDNPRRITALDISVKTEPGTEPDAASLPEGKTALGTTEVTITGAEGTADEPSQLKAGISVKNSMLDMGNRGVLSGDIELAARLASGTNKLEVDRLTISTGRSLFDFTGVVGPRPPTGEANDAPAYRFDMISRNSRSAPEDSPEAPIEFMARVAGAYDVNSSTLNADEIGVRSGDSSDLLGKASIQFVEGKTPGIVLALNAHQMPVAHVKQFWPWLSARAARSWVLQKLFGGRVPAGELQVRVAPGRLGEGTPLGREESFGRFEVVDTRFDVAGHIPPIRDAAGVVDFAGTDVDISLSSGSVFLPSGRSVAATNGSLKITAAHIQPLIGKLDIDVAGTADAIIELTSYDPINAMRKVGFLPEDLSGTVKGHVRADIPLAKGIDSSTLDWLVTLDYTDLSIAKPFSGQTLTEADGTINVSPQQAVISAKGLLNGIPAEIALTEPLRPDQPARNLEVTLNLDDRSRNALVPGLSAMLSGPVKVKLDVAGEGQPQKVEADLSRAKLDLPWIGWSKGAGVPASVSFVLAREGAQATLSDFQLDGKTFGATGSLVLNGGSLTSARFDRVQLNRDDEASITIRREGRGYAISINGDSLDVRPLVKQFMSEETGTRSKSSLGSTPIAINAKVDTLIGFYDERLSGVTLNYAGSGSSISSLEVKATSRGGGAITMSNGVSDGNRRIEMRSSDAGAVLRFLNVYERMKSGGISLSLTGPEGGTLKGLVDARDFVVVNEPRLASIVSTRAPGSDRSLSQAVDRQIDTSQVKFERGAANIERRPGYLSLSNGVLRGADIGTTFQGVVYDENDVMNLTGTFMPAYGLNRLFGELPLIGAILGNGRDRGLIGVTYKLSGNAKSPNLSVNPLSVIAPGIFRAIFEY